MEYLQIKNGEALQITTHGNVEWDSTHYCPASKLTPDEAAQFDVHPLTVTTAPAIDPTTQSVARDGCELVEGAWQYKWTVTDKDAVTIAAETEAKRVASIPQAVTMRQARLALLAAGLLDTVETSIAAAGQAAKIEWEYAQEVQRSAGLVPAMATALGMTELQIDALFIAAGAL